jgi:hypothetical protein
MAAKCLVQSEFASTMHIRLPSSVAAGDGREMGEMVGDDLAFAEGDALFAFGADERAVRRHGCGCRYSLLV